MRLSRSALFFGVLFVAVGAAYLLEDLGVWTLRAGVFLPIVLVVGGLALTVSAFAGQRRI